MHWIPEKTNFMALYDYEIEIAIKAGGEILSHLNAHSSVDA